MAGDAVLTAGSTLSCGHKGGITMTTTSSLTVSEQGVLTLKDLPTAVMAAPPCPLVTSGTTTVQCAKTIPAPGATGATALVVDGSPVLLATAFAATLSTNGIPLAPTTAVAGQTLLTAQ